MGAPEDLASMCGKKENSPPSLGCETSSALPLVFYFSSVCIEGLSLVHDELLQTAPKDWNSQSIVL